jgi:hypothetical protein
VQQAFAMHDHLSDLSSLIKQEQSRSQVYIVRLVIGGHSGPGAGTSISRSHCGMVLIAAAAKPRSSHPAVAWHEVVNTGLAVLLSWVFPTWQFPKQLGRRSLLNYLIQTHSDRTYAYIAKYGATAFWQTSRQAMMQLSQALRQGYDRTAQLAPKISTLLGDCWCCRSPHYRCF